MDERLVERARAVLVTLGFPLVAVAVVYRMTGRFVVIDGERADVRGREALRVASDPVIAAAGRSNRPISWTGLGSRVQQASIEGAGFRFGVTVPVYGPQGLMVLVTVAGRPFVGSQEALDVPLKLRDVGLAVLDGVRVGDRDARRHMPLSDTQREAIRMIASGYPVHEVARLEGVSDAAIKNRVERAKNSLGARSISELVARAMLSGELGAMRLDGL
ncbi:MAG: LuxR C-terminal-related transcriptional regulator [Gammaproteobacteria bacterium]|nr:LuxR C-terminal-related transcriptional regulator [Gammaproteobacteria bacterium]